MQRRQARRPRRTGDKQTADALGQLYLHLFQLLFQPQGSHRIAQKQVLGILIIDKITVRIGLGLAAALGNRLAVIVFILDDMDAKAAQHILFPLARVGRHMDCHMKPKLGAHNPDGKAQVAR